MYDKIKEYINKQKNPQKEICIYLRNLIHKTIPDVKEEMRWGVPVFAGGKFYIGSFKNSVNLGFSINGLNDREVALFEGTGKTMRHIKIKSLQIIDEEKLIKLIKLVDEKSVCTHTTLNFFRIYDKVSSKSSSYHPKLLFFPKHCRHNMKGLIECFPRNL